MTSITKLRSGRSILVRKSRLVQQLNVVDDEGINRTPKPLDPYIYEGTKERQITSTSVVDDVSEMSKTYLMDVTKVTKKSETRFNIETQDLMSTKRTSETYESHTNEVFEEIQQDQMETSMVIVKVPTHISLILRETDTFFILDIPSSTEYRDSEEGQKILEENEYYDYLTQGKGRNRRTITVAIQTVPTLMKMRDTDCVQIKLKSTGSFASNWEMYDTLNEVQDETQLIIEENPDVLNTVFEEKPSIDSYKMSTEERQILKIIKSQKFQDALCVVERLLANNYYNEQQKIFRDISDEYKTYTDDEIQYNYTLDHLWAFGSNAPNNVSVVAMQWNPVNKDLLAVAHGKFYNTDWISPNINIWNIKNPVQPERNYKFSNPITDICFSQNTPNILGVSFYNGQICLINISYRDLHVIAHTEKLDRHIMDICSTIQFIKSNRNDNEEEFIVIYQSGKVILFRTTSTRFLKYQQIMCAPRSDGKLKGLETLRRCSRLNIPVSRFAGALVFCQNPVDPSIYYIGTYDGVIHTCSRNYLNQHLDLFLAHDGPVISMHFHPFCHKIFVTCGSDMYTRVWAEGISEPLLQYCLSLSTTTDFLFSPTHPTMGVSINKSKISIWDLQRKAFKPQSETMLPAGSNCTCVRFTDNGKCLIVGDTSGQVHVYGLKEMPYPPFFPENLIITTFKQILIYKPQALEKLAKGLKKTSVRQRMKEIKINVPRPKNDEDIKCKAIDKKIDLKIEENEEQEIVIA